MQKRLKYLVIAPIYDACQRFTYKHRVFIQKYRKEGRYQVSSSKWQNLRKKVIKRDGRVCTLCGRKNLRPGKRHDRPGEQRHDALTIDHVVPVSEGGRYELGNLRVVCYHCHLGLNGDHRQRRGFYYFRDLQDKMKAVS